jgi:hypothetical protein
MLRTAEERDAKLQNGLGSWLAELEKAHDQNRVRMKREWAAKVGGQFGDFESCYHAWSERCP